MRQRNPCLTLKTLISGAAALSLIACGQIDSSGGTSLHPQAPVQAENFSPSSPDPAFPAGIHRSEDLSGYQQEFVGILQDARNVFEKLSPKTKDQHRCNSSKPLIVGQSQSIRIYFAIGYEDFAPANLVADLPERMMLQSFLQQPCPASFSLCGFQLKYQGAMRSVLEKTIGKTRITVTIATSSISTENDLNEKSDAQIAKSDYAVNRFLSAFRSDDIIVYWGHGRVGGGPDFYPPYLLKDNHVNYPVYSTQKVGKSLLQAGLGLRDARAKFVGIFGCNTMEMLSPIQKIYPDVNFVGSRREIDSLEMARGSLAFVAGILNNDCRVSVINRIGANKPQGKSISPFASRGPSY